jgi:hypothetical protein
MDVLICHPRSSRFRLRLRFALAHISSCADPASKMTVRSKWQAAPRRPTRVQWVTNRGDEHAWRALQRPPLVTAAVGDAAIRRAWKNRGGVRGHGQCHGRVLTFSTLKDHTLESNSGRVTLSARLSLWCPPVYIRGSARTHRAGALNGCANVCGKKIPGDGFGAIFPGRALPTARSGQKLEPARVKQRDARRHTTDCRAAGCRSDVANPTRPPAPTARCTEALRSSRTNETGFRSGARRCSPHLPPAIHRQIRVTLSIEGRRGRTR